MESVGPRTCDGEDLGPLSLHCYLQDRTFVEYFNSFLLLPAFSSSVFYNADTGFFEQVCGDGVSWRERGGGGGGGGGRSTRGGSELVTPSTSLSTLYLTDDCMGLPLDKQQCWQWVVDHRLPLFLRSDLFSEYKLCKKLTAHIEEPATGLHHLTNSEKALLAKPLVSKPMSRDTAYRQSDSPTLKERKQKHSQKPPLSERCSMENVLRVSSSTSVILPSLGQNKTGGGGRGGERGSGEGEREDPSFSREPANHLRLSKSNVELGKKGSGSKSGKGVQGSTSQPNIDAYGETTTTEFEHQSSHKRSYSLTNNYSPYYVPLVTCDYDLLATKSGMYSLWRFLQGTAGERSWLFWLDAERIKYCSTHKDQHRLIRVLREKYLNAGGPMELPTDTRFRLGVARLGAVGMEEVEQLQGRVVDSLRSYWCHRFLLHYQHKQKEQAHSRPHTSPGTYISQPLTSHGSSRVETPLMPSKTPTFYRITSSARRSRSTSIPASSQQATGRTSGGREREGWRVRSGGVRERGERVRHRRKTEGEDRVAEQKERGHSRRKHWNMSTPRLPQSLRQSYCSSPMPDWTDGMDYTTEQETSETIRSRQDWISAENSLEELDLITSTRPSMASPQLPWSGGSEGRKVWEKKSPGLDTRKKKADTLHKSVLERHVIERTACGMEQTYAETLDRAASCHKVQGSPHGEIRSIRSSDERYRKLTKYTNRHLPDPDMASTSVTDHPLVTNETPCHILSISGTPHPPPSPLPSSTPQPSPITRMLYCLTTEHRKAGGYFQQHLESLPDDVPLYCLLFWREVQDYKALFVGPSFSPSVVELKAKALHSQFIAEAGPKCLLAPPPLPAHVTAHLFPPYDDLFDDVEEYALGVLMEHWKQLCRKEEASFRKVDTVSLSRVNSAYRRVISSFSALDELNEEVNFNADDNEADEFSSLPHTPHSTTHPTHIATSRPRSSLSPFHPSHKYSPLLLSHMDSPLHCTPYQDSSPFPSPSPTPLPPTHTAAQPKAMSLNDIINNPTELEHFKIFLNENMAAQDLMCWMEIEAFRGIPPKDIHLRDLKARELRMRYFTKKYLLGPHSPASKEAQRQIVAAGGNQYSHRLPARPKTPVFREAQKHVRARLEKKWMAMFIKTPQYIVRNGQNIPEGQNREAFDGGQVVTLEQKFFHSREALLLRKALQDDSSRELFMFFLSIRKVSDTHPLQDVEFWLEVQRFKWMCHAHSNQQTLKDKLKAMKDCYFNSSVMPKLQIDVPHHMAEQAMKKNVGPYIFRETQAAVFKHLYDYWQEYQGLTQDLTREEIVAELKRMEKKMKQIQQAAEERERMMQMEIEKRHMAVPRFETAQEREERLKREKEQEQFGDVSVAFSLTSPHPDYTYYTDIPHTHSQQTQSETHSPDMGTGGRVTASKSTARPDAVHSKPAVVNTKASSQVLDEQRSKVNGDATVLLDSVVGREGNGRGGSHEGRGSIVSKDATTVGQTLSVQGVKEFHKSQGKGRKSPSVMSSGMRGDRGGRRSSNRRASGQANFIAGSTVTVQLSSTEGQKYLSDVC